MTMRSVLTYTYTPLINALIGPHLFGIDTHVGGQGRMVRVAAVPGTVGLDGPRYANSPLPVVNIDHFLGAATYGSFWALQLLFVPPENINLYDAGARLRSMRESILGKTMLRRLVFSTATRAYTMWDVVRHSELPLPRYAELFAEVICAAHFASTLAREKMLIEHSDPVWVEQLVLDIAHHGLYEDTAETIHDLCRKADSTITTSDLPEVGRTGPIFELAAEIMKEAREEGDVSGFPPLR